MKPTMPHFVYACFSNVQKLHMRSAIPILVLVSIYINETLFIANFAIFSGMLTFPNLKYAIYACVPGLAYYVEIYASII